MVINGYSLIIGIVIGVSITVIIGLIAVNREPKVELEPQKVNLPKKQSPNDIDSIKNEISKLWNDLSSLGQKSEKFFDNYDERLLSLEQHIGTDLDKDDPRKHIRVNGFNRPVVFVVKYTRNDAYGPYMCSDAFTYKEDAYAFVRGLKKSLGNVKDISISPMMIYIDKDKTLDNVDNIFNKG